jgi:hypothetical protein
MVTEIAQAKESWIDISRIFLALQKQTAGLSTSRTNLAHLGVKGRIPLVIVFRRLASKPFNNFLQFLPIFQNPFFNIDVPTAS